MVTLLWKRTKQIFDTNLYLPIYHQYLNNCHCLLDVKCHYFLSIHWSALKCLCFVASDIPRRVYITSGFPFSFYTTEFNQMPLFCNLSSFILIGCFVMISFLNSVFLYSSLLFLTLSFLCTWASVSNNPFPLSIFRVGPICIIQLRIFAQYEVIRYL